MNDRKYKSPTHREQQEEDDMDKELEKEHDELDEDYRNDPDKYVKRADLDSFSSGGSILWKQKEGTPKEKENISPKNPTAKHKKHP